MKGALSFSVRRGFHGAQRSTRKSMPTTDNLRVKNHWENRNPMYRKMSGTRSFSHNYVSQLKGITSTTRDVNDLFDALSGRIQESQTLFITLK
jgi:hypothetical protein